MKKLVSLAGFVALAFTVQAQAATATLVNGGFEASWSAVDHIGEDGDVIFIDAGTTTELLVELLDRRNLTVVTDSIHHAAKLVEKNFKTIIIGGFVKQSTDASIGRAAVEQISQLNFDKAFIGMNGVDESFLTTPDMEEAAIKKTSAE